MPFPNDRQRNVINFEGSRLVVVAGPGTGKTATLVARMIRLLSENSSREISFITFTRTSRRNTKEKIERELKESLEDETSEGYPRLSTLHTYTKAIVHKNATAIGLKSNFSVLVVNKGEKSLVIDEVYSDLELSIDLQSLDEGITCYRSTGQWPFSFSVAATDRIAILERFETLLTFYNSLDMEGIVVKANQILEQDVVTLPPLYLQVDEYQDLNPSEQQFVKLVAQHPKSQVIVVGDDAQSIYDFRYANYKDLSVLWNSGEWATESLSESHRVPSHIKRAVIELLDGRSYMGHLDCSPTEEGSKLRVFQCSKADYQSNVVGSLINHLLANRTNRKGEPLTWKDFLVLCPSGNAIQSMKETLETSFSIPVRIYEKPSIPADHWRLQLVLRMLHYKDTLALRQWLDISGVTSGEITNIRLKAMETNKTLFEYCATIENITIKQIYNSLEKLEQALGDAKIFKQSLFEFPNLHADLTLFPDILQTLEEANIELSSIGAVIRLIYEKFGLIDPEGELPNEDCVLITTLHSAKGLEAEYVFVTWMNSSLMPLPERDEEEQRRLLYVALTRATQDAVVTYYNAFDPKRERPLGEKSLSRFLLEIKNHLSIVKVKKADLDKVPQLYNQSA